MPRCMTVKMPSGGVTIMCGRGAQKPKPCSACGSPSTKLCDYPVANASTCDKPLCGACAVRVGHDLDHCPDHPRSQMALAL